MGLLELTSRSSYYAWLREARNADPGGGVDVVPPLYMLDRLSRLMNVHSALVQLFPNSPPTRDGWITRPNTDFQNHTPIETTRSEILGLYQVQMYLESALG